MKDRYKYFLFLVACGIYTISILLAEVKTHKVERFLYGEPASPEMVNGIPVMQDATEQGWTNCLNKLDIQRDIVFFGNSITRNSDFRLFFPDASIANLGLGGDNLDGFLRRVTQVKALKPHKVFFMGGINGNKYMDPDTFKVKYERIVSALKDSLPNTQLYLQSILPVHSSKYDLYADNDKIKLFNDKIQEIALQHKCIYIDLYSAYISNGEMPLEYTQDGIHLLPEHYDKWANLIAPYIQK